jgi:hypothetical protein
LYKSMIRLTRSTASCPPPIWTRKRRKEEIKLSSVCHPFFLWTRRHAQSECPQQSAFSPLQWTEEVVSSSRLRLRHEQWCGLSLLLPALVW